MLATQRLGRVIQSNFLEGTQLASGRMQNDGQCVARLNTGSLLSFYTDIMLTDQGTNV